jgi:hypothetical protein
MLAVLFAGIAFNAHAETPKAGEKISLKLNVAKGDKKSYVTTQNLSNQISAGGQTIDLKTEMTVNTNLEVKDVAADGVTTIEIIHKRVQLTAAGPLEMKYDSDDASTANNALAQQVAGLAGNSVSAKFDAQAKVIKDKDADNAKISARLQESIEQLISALPSHPVAIGDSWDDEYEIKSTPSMPMKVSGKYTLKDVRDGVAYLKYDAKVTSTADLKGSITGDAEIDQKTGLTTKFVGNMKVEGKQAGTDFKLDGELTVKAE